MGVDAPCKVGSDDEAVARPVLLEFSVKIDSEEDKTAVLRLLEGLSDLEVLKIDKENKSVIVQTTRSPATILSCLRSGQFLSALIGSGGSVRLENDNFEPPEFLRQILSCVAEFKGHSYMQGSVLGVVRIVQQTMSSSVVHASLSGLKASTAYKLAVHVYGSLNPARVGSVFTLANTELTIPSSPTCGLLGSAVSDSRGDLEISAEIELVVSKIIGRSVVVHEDVDSDTNGIASSIIARSAAIGANPKKVCLCDGTVVWEATEKSNGIFM